tara:strand:- start:3756 stop:3890 length:135 start_codon:yes stop_codon:yes gene_type:complete
MAAIADNFKAFHLTTVTPGPGFNPSRAFSAKPALAAWGDAAILT